MQIRRHEAVGDFREIATPLLMTDEPGNCGVLGLLDEAEALRWSAWEHGELRGVMIQSGDRPVILSTGPAEIGEGFAGEVAADKQACCGVYGPVGSARTFCARYAKVTGRSVKLQFRGAVHRLDHVTRPTGVAGELSAATSEDEGTVVPWVAAFAKSIGEPHRDAAGHFRMLVGKHRLFVWRDEDGPRSMAAWAGPTPNGIRINSVYTPPEFRNRGFASAAVAALSQRLLDFGKRFCFLNTDLDNPTSNSIYRKIGYVRCGETESYRFA